MRQFLHFFFFYGIFHQKIYITVPKTDDLLKSGRTQRQCLNVPGKDTTATLKTAPASTAVSSSTSMKMTTPSLSMAVPPPLSLMTAGRCVCGRPRPPPVTAHQRSFPSHETTTSVLDKDSLLIRKIAAGFLPVGTTWVMGRTLTMSSVVPLGWPSMRPTCVVNGRGWWIAVPTTVS